MDDIQSVSNSIESAEPKETVKPTHSATSNEVENTGNSENPGDQSANADDQSDASEQEGSDKPKKKNGFAKRVDRLNRNISERDQTIASLQKELEQARKPAQSDQSQKSESKLSDGEPNQQDFESNAEYIRAYTKWQFDQAKSTQEKELAEAKARDARKEIQTSYDGRLNEFKAAQADFDEVVADFADTYGDFKASPAIINTLMLADHGPEVLYGVLKDHAEYDRLSKLSESEIIREIHKKDARIALRKESEAQSQTQTQSKPKTTSAPKPPAPISSASTKVNKSYDDMSFDEFMAARNAESRRRR